MTDSSVPVAVLSPRLDHVEAFNKTMRDAGLPVRCYGTGRLDQLEAALQKIVPHLLIFFADEHSASIQEVAELGRAKSPMTPLIVVRDTVDEPAIGEALKEGARDLVCAANAERMRIVCERELRRFQLEHELEKSLRSARQYQERLKGFMLVSADAIAQVHEGIVVEANQAWTELFGSSDAADCVPLMDLFTPASQVAIKGALIACGKGQWDGNTLSLDAITGADQSVSVLAEMQPSSHDGEPTIRISLRPRAANEAETSEASDDIVERALDSDASTGFLLRQQFLEILAETLGQRRPGNGRALAYVRPDRFGEIEREVGPVASEEIIHQLAETFSGLLADGDIAARFGGNVFTFIIERDSFKAVQTWAEEACRRIADRLFDVADRSISLTCSIGLAEICSGRETPEALTWSAAQANLRSREQDGNQVVVRETSDESTRIKRIDELWVHRIKSALVENRFRLVHMNIASLSGLSERLLDTVVQMIDEQGDEVHAAEFMASAARNNLMRSIDRWVIDATLKYCQREACDVVFVKLSYQSLLDAGLPKWVVERLQATGVKSSKLCFQVTEADASQYQKQAAALGAELRRYGCRFAIEHFGIGRDAERLLMTVPMDFVKFDGSLIQQMTNDLESQEMLASYIATANSNNIMTIAERVENANTMAILFQIGVGYMQGHYLHEPEVVLEEAI